MIISCWRRVSGRSGDISAPNVAKAWCSASGIRVCVATMLVAAVVARVPRVLLRVEPVLRLERPAQRLVGLRERDRLDPGHQVSSAVLSGASAGDATNGRPESPAPPRPSRGPPGAACPPRAARAAYASRARKPSGVHGIAGDAKACRVGGAAADRARRRSGPRSDGDEDEVGDDRVERAEEHEHAARARPGRRWRGRASRSAGWSWPPPTAGRARRGPSRSRRAGATIRTAARLPSDAITTTAAKTRAARRAEERRRRPAPRTPAPEPTVLDRHQIDEARAREDVHQRHDARRRGAGRAAACASGP